MLLKMFLNGDFFRDEFYYSSTSIIFGNLYVVLFVFVGWLLFMRDVFFNVLRFYCDDEYWPSSMAILYTFDCLLDMEVFIVVVDMFVVL